jgi:tetratricopeptide (TPR) repeat protein
MRPSPGFGALRLLTLILLGLPGLFGQASDLLAKAEELYRQTDYRSSLALARESGPANGAAWFLIGRDYFMLGDYKKAAEALERAIALEPSNSQFALWLGRSFGRRAELAAPFLGAKYASQARANFEKAVALDPNNPEALNELFDYYLEAPGWGGSYDKAERIERQIAVQNPTEGHFAQVRLAERRKQFDTAEEQVGRLLDLALHIVRHGRVAGSEATFDRAKQLLNEAALLGVTSGS